MKRLKMMTIFGTRPEAIKMAPLINKMQERDEIESIVCITAQHREMLDSVLKQFKIEPDYDLDIMKHGQTITDITTRVLQGIESVLKESKPDMVLVHGDTTTTFVAALAGFYQKIPIGHVEAGLRSGNMSSPYPEEMNRKLTSSLANMHFAPTVENFNNLVKEGISKEKIFITGNTVIDALLQTIEEEYVFKNLCLNEIDFINKKIIVMTVHRRENWGQPMEDIFSAVNEIVAQNRDVEIVYPVHLNPKIKELANKFLGNNKQIHLIDPLDYKPFANLLNKAYLILTDSGGIQEEAPALKKPILVVRDETERPEAVEAGTVKVIGIKKLDIVNEMQLLINDENSYKQMSRAINPYGDGTASEKILEEILIYHRILL
ncbi:MAG: UDP-N-acetylglucosamine 2-epimerase (non-hydrolyzing) [Clostridiales bacterium]|nr:UDP-N-acetylglucosamine 2-epimerase (non-hydrolyzing) [Clostridiales bacterium]